MAITYNAGTNIITVTGYTEATPCNSTDIYNADVGGGWGAVTRQCTNQFCFNCRVVIGDGSTATWFADVNKLIVFLDVFTSNNQVLIELKNNSHFTLGTLVDASTLSTKNACTILTKVGTARTGDIISARSEATPTAVLKLYGCTLQMDQQHSIYLYKLKYGELYNLRLENGVSLDSLELTIDNVQIVNPDKALLLAWGVTATFKNVSILNERTAIVNTYLVTNDSYFINIKTSTDAWTIAWYNSTGKFYRQYELDLKVIDKDNAAINNATVKIWDKDSNLVVDTTTNAGGVITTQTITRGYYDQAHGNTLQEKSPHTIEIKKDGTNYLTYETDFILDNKKDWVISMVDMSDIVDGINDLKGTGFVKATDSNTAIRDRGDDAWIGKEADIIKLLPFVI